MNRQQIGKFWCGVIIMMLVIGDPLWIWAYDLPGAGYTVKSGTFEVVGNTVQACSQSWPSSASVTYNVPLTAGTWLVGAEANDIIPRSLVPDCAPHYCPYDTCYDQIDIDITLTCPGYPADQDCAPHRGHAVHGRAGRMGSVHHGHRGTVHGGRLLFCPAAAQGHGGAHRPAE